MTTPQQFQHWTVLTISKLLFSTGVKIIITTNNACHLTCFWKRTPPTVRRGFKIIRGEKVFCEPKFTFSKPYLKEQDEAGDTTTHTFTLLDWPTCETRWFFFKGTVGPYSSSSKSAFMVYHKTMTIITQYFYPDWHPEVSSVDGYTRRYWTWVNWDNIRNGAGTYFADGMFNLALVMQSQAATGYYVALNRINLVFDTRLMAFGSIPLVASLDLYARTKSNTWGLNPAIVLTPCTTSKNTELVNADYQSFADVICSDTIAYNDIQLTAWNTLHLNQAGLMAIKPADWTKFAVRFTPYDIPYSIPPWVANKLVNIEFHSADSSHTLRPRLAVTYGVT